MSNDTEDAVDELTAFINETVEYIEEETGVRPPVAPVTFSIAVQGGVSFNEDGDLYNTVVLLCTHPDNPALVPYMFAVPKQLYSDLFDPVGTDTLPEEETNDE